MMAKQQTTNFVHVQNVDDDSPAGSPRIGARHASSLGPNPKQGMLAAAAANAAKGGKKDVELPAVKQPLIPVAQPPPQAVVVKTNEKNAAAGWARMWKVVK